MSVDPAVHLAYVSLHLVAVGVAGSLSYWIGRHVDIPGRRWFVAWMGSFGCWSLVSAVSLLVSTQPVAAVLFVLWVLVGLAAVALTVCFATAYSGREPRENRLCQASAGVFVVLGVLAVTGPFHDVYWRSGSFRTDPFPHYAIEPGPAWIAAILFGVVAVLIFGYYFAELYFRSRRQQKRAVFVLMITPVVGFLPLVLSVFDLLVVSSYDHISYVGVINALGVSYAVVRFGSHSVGTVGRDAVINHLSDPYIAVDRQFRVVDYNEASEVFAEPSGIQLGKPLAETVPALADELLTETGLVEPTDILTLTAGDHPRHYTVTVSELTVHETATGSVLFLNDVSDLEASRRRIAQQNEQLDAFAGTVSHDLRSPLHIANGHVGLLKKTYDDDRLEEIDAAHKRMGTLLDDLLVLAREGTQVGETEPVRLDTVVEASWQQINTHEATLQTSDSQQLAADPTRLQQLLENLIRNAVEHGGPEVTVTVGTIADGFYLADDGPGIPEDERAEIFDMSYTTSPQGTGLGLHIIHQIVEGHGWDIDVIESDDGGARFEITGVEWIDHTHSPVSAS